MNPSSKMHCAAVTEVPWTSAQVWPVLPPNLGMLGTGMISACFRVVVKLRPGHTKCCTSHTKLPYQTSDLRLQNATHLRKSVPEPPNISGEHVSCTAPAR